MANLYEFLDAAFDDARRAGYEIKSIRLGADLREDFELSVGAAYVNGEYFGVPLTFDAINSSGISWDAEPKT